MITLHILAWIESDKPSQAAASRLKGGASLPVEQDRPTSQLMRPSPAAASASAAITSSLNLNPPNQTTSMPVLMMPFNSYLSLRACACKHRLVADRQNRIVGAGKTFEQKLQKMA